jgi:two-component sensor histidine kinase
LRELWTRAERGRQFLLALRHAEKDVIKVGKPRPLSERVFLIQQIVPFLLLIVVMFYEVTQHLIFQSTGPLWLFAFEILVFGIFGPAVVWLTLHWVGREIRARELAQDEADARTTMMRELHHRIKNNLQTITDLLSLELARGRGRGAEESLRDSVARIKSIAAAHDLLSIEQVSTTDITELARRVAESVRVGLVRPEQAITVKVTGLPIFLPSKSATAFALVINELVSNALEHGLAARLAGVVDIHVSQVEDEIAVRVRDNGAGLAKDFDLNRQAGLGLQIVRTLIEKDLHGSLRFNNDRGTSAEFTFRIKEGVEQPHYK